MNLYENENWACIAENNFFKMKLVIELTISKDTFALILRKNEKSILLNGNVSHFREKNFRVLSGTFSNGNTNFKFVFHFVSFSKKIELTSDVIKLHDVSADDQKIFTFSGILIPVIVNDDICPEGIFYLSKKELNIVHPYPYDGTK